MATPRLLLLAFIISLTACNPNMKQEAPVVPLAAAAQAPQPPIAAKKPYQVVSPNGSREDEYYWLRDDKRENPQMLDYIKQENAYADAMLAHTKALETKVYQEIIGRLQQDDSSVPYRMNGYWYFRRFETGKEYPIYSRRADTPNAPEEILLNANELAKGHDFFEIGDIAISPDSKLIAWAEDTVGRRQYVVKVMELATRKEFPVALGNVENNIVWAGDNKTFFYIEKDPKTLLGYRVRKHSLDSANRDNVTADPLVWEQTDDSFYTQLSKTKDEKYLLITTQSTVSTEVLYADANAAQPAFKVFLPRERDHEYQVEHANGRWIVRTNYQAKNFRIVAVARGAEGDRTKWVDVVAHRDDAFIDAYDVARNFLSIEEHSGGLRKLRIRPWKGADVFVTADEPSYTMALDTNREFNSDKLRYTYQSMVTPRTTYDYDFSKGTREMLKREPVLGGYDPAKYATEFAWATARDGVKVPVSIVYAKTTPRDGTAPLLHNCMSAKARHELLLPAGKKTEIDKKSTLKHNPIEEFRASIYWAKTGPTLVQHLSSAFRGAMRSAALDLPGITKAEVGRMLWVEGDRIDIYGMPLIDMRIVRQAGMNRTPDVRTRAIMREWAAKVVISYTMPQLKQQSVANLLSAAGLYIGIGDYRNEKGAGNYGLFAICPEDHPGRRGEQPSDSAGRNRQTALNDLQTSQR